jgi:hypothetical protein
MTENKNQVGPQSGKPSWFELVDSDAPSAQVVKVNKKLPVIALFVTAAIAASGTFFANASNSSASTPQPMTSANTTVASTPATTASPDTKNVNALSTTAPKSDKVQNPSQGGVQAPSAGRGDDHDGREGREGHDRGERDHEERDDY